MDVLTDGRWPSWTGIGRMGSVYANARPEATNLTDVKASARIGSPLSPFSLATAIRRNQRPKSIFWNPGFIPAAHADIRSIVTVHDLTHLHFYTKLHKLYYDVVLRPMYRRTDTIVCISEFTRTEFLAWSGMDPSRVRVIYNCLPDGFADQAEVPDSEHPYIFYPGNHRKYKNLSVLISAFARSGLSSQGVELRLTGDPTPYLVDKAHACKVKEQVRFLGRLSDAEIVRCYKGAACVAFVSRYEGFGLPLLEAMACSVPLVISDASCLPEIAGDAALAVGPDDVDAMADALNRVVTDSALAAELRARGHVRLRAFDAQNSSTLLWKTIEETFSCV